MTAPRALVLADEPPHVPLELLLEEHRPDAVFVLGDLRGDVLAPLARFGGPKLGVHGNHDRGDEFDAPGIEDVHLRPVDLLGLRVAGFGGSVRTGPGSGLAWSQEEAEDLLAGLSPVDVLLAHSPPFGVNDDRDDPVHVGLRGLRGYVERAAPALLVHGHTYPPLPATALDSTRIRYVRGHALVELPDVE